MQGEKVYICTPENWPQPMDFLNKNNMKTREQLYAINAEKKEQRIKDSEADKRSSYGYKTNKVRQSQRLQLEALEAEYAALKSYLTDYAMELYSRINNLRNRV